MDLVPIAFFGMIAAIVLVPRYFKNKEREQLQTTLRAAIERGQPLPPEVIAAITSDAPTVRQPRTGSDLRKGIVWLAIAAGIAAFAWVIGYQEDEAFYPLLSLAIIPGFVGVAYVAIAAVNRSHDPKPLNVQS